ncbi:hypothetical protein [Terasakiella sp.]|uniref:hypothetical protein n=1 Tax=Terasakiella sp. TaxID=2034861 RepID=UPI003AA7BECA
MMRSLPHKLSLTMTLGFALWLVLLWVMPGQEDHKVEKKQQNREAQPITQPVEDSPVVQAAIVLPSPPKVEITKVEAPKPVVKAPKRVEPKKTTKKIVEKQPVKPTPQPVVQAKPKPAPKPVERQTELKPIKPAPPIETVQEVSVAQATGGRALLRVLEHGKGPQIEIAWPQEAKARDLLFARFQQCFGMESVVMDGAGNLYRTAEGRGTRWEINMDRYSGFLRQAAGQIPQAERRIEQAILRHHRGLNDPSLVRIFPRRVDASLLGGLQSVAGPNYMQANHIRARYELQNNRVVVRDIRLNGAVMDGMIALAPYKRC